MATIVKHKQSGETYIALGAGYGAWHSNTPDPLWGAAKQKTEAGSYSLIAVTRADGEIGWFDSTELLVVSVDGKPPHQILDPGGPYR